jgi:uncharacterized membrane-anchored protein
MRTTYMTKSGEEITDQRMIAKRYILHSTFFVDLLSILPLNAVIPVIIKNISNINYREIKIILMHLAC